MGQRTQKEVNVINTRPTYIYISNSGLRNRKIETMEEIAKVFCSQGRLWLSVAGYAVAMQGDRLRDQDLPLDESGCPCWSAKSLNIVADEINRRVGVDEPKMVRCPDCEGVGRRTIAWEGEPSTCATCQGSKFVTKKIK